MRLVVYDMIKRTPLPLINEKYLCGLARNMEQTGKLNQSGKELALEALGRFFELLRLMKIKNIKVFATSAVRDASDGMELINILQNKWKAKVNILSGDEEAEFAALGVISSVDEVDGIVGDLGGGSLELISVDYKMSKSKLLKDAIKEKASYPIGSLRLRSQSKGNKNTARQIAGRALKNFSLDKKLKDKNFYAVGGGFRALAKQHIASSNYPLSVIHQYKVDAQKLLRTAKRVASMDAKKIKLLPAFSSSRADTLAISALIMEQIIEIGKPENIIFSAHGVREGVLAGELGVEDQKKDALIEAVSDIMMHISPEDDGWIRFGYELYEWMTPLFRNESKAIKRFRLAACILSRLAWHEHVAYRAEMAFRWVIDAAIPAIDHQGRVFVAACVYHRYMQESNPAVQSITQSLLKEEQIFRARVIGSAMSLGYGLSRGALGVLGGTPLTLNAQDQLILSAKSEKERILFGGNMVKRRLDNLGRITGLKVILENK